ncbi:Phenol hydroxylase [Psilocybe cubensis]|uniref:Phenol hydroxylase n=1 Tax=Psilocybe cubensis TaxID=181762 RepID=A0ACB8GVP4_PSICU|nr:Phenol hydroxylase [Psilocybe cubensis]KAH9479089.1 Phenol hydroxylase [Psilocybe cubensis]
MSPSTIDDLRSTGRALNHGDTRPVQYSHCDVLVVGAGPSGLMIAQALGRLGIQVRVIERRVQGSQYGNADGLQPRTLEIWKSYGMLSKIRAKGVCVRAMVAYETVSNGGGLSRLRPSSSIVVPCRYQYEIAASINDIEGTLRENADEAGVQVTQPCWPTSVHVAPDVDSALSVKGYPIKVVIEHPSNCCQYHTGRVRHQAQENNTNRYYNACTCNQDSEAQGRVEIVNAKYVIGADGASSWVRRSLGIDMEGEQTEDVWGVVDVLVDTDLPDYRFKCVIQAASGAIIIIPREGDKVRIYVQLSAEDSIPRDVDGELDKSNLEEGEIRQKILLNRIFIVGDACHTHSPKAGQGANASMGDSHNLGELLPSRPLVIEFNMNRGIGISYASSSLTVQPATAIGHIVPGERILSSPITRLADWADRNIHDLLISDGTFKMLVFPGDISSPQSKSRLSIFAKALSESISMKEIDSREGLRIDIYTIVRNDKAEVIWTDIPAFIARSWRR